MKITEMYDLSETIASGLFDGKEYPWEVLSDIGNYILKIGPTLPKEEFEYREGDIWIHKSVTIANTATLNGPLIMQIQRSDREHLSEGMQLLEKTVSWEILQN